MNQLTTALSIFHAPASAFSELKRQPTFLLPLLLLLFSLSAAWAWYYATVDLPWLQSHLLQSKQSLDPNEAEIARSVMSRGFLLAATVGGTVVLSVVAWLAWATYYLLVNRALGNHHGMLHWLAFSAFASLPLALVAGAMAAQLLADRSGHLAPETLNALSLNQLLFHLPPAHALAPPLNAISLLTIWSITVSIIGLRQWGIGRGAVAAAIVIAPYIALYGGWLLIASLRTVA